MTIKDHRFRSLTKAVFKAFMGPLRIQDPSHVRIREKEWAIAQEVFHPPNPWSIKDANTFMAKNLTYS